MVKEVKKECENERITHLLLVHLQYQMGTSKERESTKNKAREGERLEWSSRSTERTEKEEMKKDR